MNHIIKVTAVPLLIGVAGFLLYQSHAESPRLECLKSAIRKQASAKKCARHPDKNSSRNQRTNTRKSIAGDTSRAIGLGNRPQHQNESPHANRVRPARDVRRSGRGTEYGAVRL